MKIFIGVKRSDFESVAQVLTERVEYISWPDDNNEKSDVISATMEKLESPQACYIHFSGYQRLSRNELKIFQNNCINIHPAPPKYPGVGGLNHALYNNEKFFGVTIHLMNSQIDDGRILNVIPFPINHYKCLQDAIGNLGELRLEILQDIVTDISQTSFTEYINKHNHNEFSWSKKMWSRKELDAMQTVSIDGLQHKHEIERRIRAFQTDKFPIQLKINKRLFSLVEVHDDKI